MAIKEVEDLLAGLKLTAEEKAQMEAILASEERQKEIKRGYHGAQEADRLMSQARAAEEAARAKEAEANEKIAGWMKWYEDEQPKLEAQLTQAQAAIQKEAMLRAYATSQGIDLEGLGQQPIVQTQPAPEAFSWEKISADPNFTKTFIPREEATQSLNAVLALGDLQHKLNLKHRNLFGKDVEDWGAIRQEAFNAKKPLDVYADEKFGFTAKEKELADKALEERAEKMAQERYAALISKQGIPQPTGDPADGVALFSDEFTNKGRVSDAEANRLAVERALQYDAQHPEHSSNGTPI